LHRQESKASNRSDRSPIVDHLQRRPFSGDGRGILEDEARVKATLKVVAKPTAVTIRAALVRSGFQPTAVVRRPTRCVWQAWLCRHSGQRLHLWASYAGELTVDVGGYINVDGRLAAYGH
jgi:hypothetical protein